MKGVFESQKPKPKYTTIWDVSVVLIIYQLYILMINDDCH